MSLGRVLTTNDDALIARVVDIAVRATDDHKDMTDRSVRCKGVEHMPQHGLARQPCNFQQAREAHSVARHGRKAGHA